MEKLYVPVKAECRKDSKAAKKEKLLKSAS